MFKKYFALLASAVILLFSLTAYASPAELFHNAADPVIGKSDDKVSVAMFFDYRCSHCINTTAAVDKAINENPDVRFIFKELPVFGAPSELGARAALAANMQGKYYDFHYALFTANKPINDALIASIAKNLNLDLAKLKKDMNSKAITDELKATRKLALSSGVRGTPAFFFGKTDAEKMDQIKLVLGEMKTDEINKAINNAAS